MNTTGYNSLVMRWGWRILAFSAALMGLYALAFFAVEEINPGIKAHFAGIRVGAMIHIIPGGIAILLGLAQFHTGLRQARPAVHRTLGQAYFICVGISAAAALFISFKPFGGIVGGFGLGLLAVVWGYTGWQAYIAARRGEFVVHQRWMIRNYALTLAAVTIRIYISGFPALDLMSFDDAYQVATWLCWVPNLLLVEWWILRRTLEKSG